MMVYSYDNEGKLVGEVEISDGDALPSMTTDITPPNEIEEGGECVFNGMEWSVIPIIVTVPTVISMRQARLALHFAGLLETINTAVKTNTAWEIEWDYATEVRRDSPILLALQESMEMDDSAIDALFITGSKL